MYKRMFNVTDQMPMQYFHSCQQYRFRAGNPAFLLLKLPSFIGKYPVFVHFPLFYEPMLTAMYFLPSCNLHAVTEQENPQTK